jgi:hypothetical protein
MHRAIDGRHPFRLLSSSAHLWSPSISVFPANLLEATADSCSAKSYLLNQPHTYLLKEADPKCLRHASTCPAQPQSAKVSLKQPQLDPTTRIPSRVLFPDPLPTLLVVRQLYKSSPDPRKPSTLRTLFFPGPQRVYHRTSNPDPQVRPSKSRPPDLHLLTSGPHPF